MMTQRLWWCVGYGLILGLLCSLLPAQAAQRKLLIVGEAWAPFEFEQDGRVVGMDVDIARYILTRMDIDFEMRIMPWSRAWSMIQNGQADAAFSVSRKAERQEFLLYPQEDMWTSEYVFFARRDRQLPPIENYRDVHLKQLQVGVVRDNSYNDEFWKVFPRTPEGKLYHLLQPARNADINFKKLARGRIDLYIIDKTIGLYNLSQMRLQQEIAPHGAVLFAKGYPMPFARKSDYPDLPGIAARFEQALVELKASGEYDKIRERWLK